MVNTIGITTYKHKADIVTNLDYICMTKAIDRCLHIHLRPHF